MSEDDIRSLVYDHADGFSSGIVFSDQGIVDFARALLNQAGLAAEVAQSTPAAYEADLQRLQTSVERLIR